MTEAGDQKIEPARANEQMNRPQYRHWATVERFDVVESTMSMAAERARSGAGEGTTIVARHQTHGRGRRGKRWDSPRGGLWFSTLLIPPARAPSPLSTLSLVAGLAVRDGLASAGVEGLGLKWPNDIWVRERKIAGVLAELLTLPSGSPAVILGVGINVGRHGRGDGSRPDSDANAADVAESAYPVPRIGLHDLVPDLDPQPVLSTVLTALAWRYHQWTTRGWDSLVEAWSQHDLLWGRSVVAKVEPGPQTRTGIGCGVDRAGRLMLQIGNKNIELDSGEVFAVRGAPGSPDPVS